MYLQLRVRIIYPYLYTETVYRKVSTNACWHSSVNDAGLGLVTPLECTTMEMAKELFEVNFFGTLRLIQAVLPGMKTRQNGCTVEPRFNEPLYNEDLDITNHFLYPNNSKIYEK